MAVHWTFRCLVTIAASLLVSAEEVEVYFGCGCFWHVQHEFFEFEKTLGRADRDVTARCAYGGSAEVKPDDLVCYHGDDRYDYGLLGFAEAVKLRISASNFAGAAQKFFSSICKDGMRQDPQDAGSEYRSIIGLPGGMESPLYKELDNNKGGAILKKGQGNDPDTEHSVYIYDTAKFPAHVAEKYHQFHDDMIDDYPSEYNEMQQYAEQTQCPGDAGLSNSFFQLLS